MEDHIPLKGHRPVLLKSFVLGKEGNRDPNLLDLVVETASVADRLLVLRSTPQRCHCRVTINAHKVGALERLLKR